MLHLPHKLRAVVAALLTTLVLDGVLVVLYLGLFGAPGGAGDLLRERPGAGTGIAGGATELLPVETGTGTGTSAGAACSSRSGAPRGTGSISVASSSSLTGTW